MTAGHSSSISPLAHPARPVVAADAPGAAARNRALDFTKGALVVCMVVYHALNYFRYDVNLLRHLHFLPPSFIFIVGFLITHVYWPKARSGDLSGPRRLFVRGLKTLVLFIGLNLLVHSLFSWSFNRALGLDVFLSQLDAIFVTGEQRASVFTVLLPISYVLLLSALLLFLSRYTRYVLHAVAIGVFIVSAILARLGHLVFNLDLVSTGLLGLVVGFIPRRRLDGLAERLLPLVLLYLAYSIVVRFQYPTYLLNTLGVGLSLLLFYSVGLRFTNHWAAEVVTFLGTYSLLSYLVQIAILQTLLRAARSMGLPHDGVIVPMLVTFGLMLAIVKGVHHLRHRVRALDRAYLAVFA